MINQRSKSKNHKSIPIINPNSNNSNSNNYNCFMNIFRNKKKTFFIIFLLFLSLYAFSQSSFFTPLTFNNSKFTPTLHNSNNFSPSQLQDSIFTHTQIKIYMYDLPREFTYGVIESYAIARGGKNEKNEKNGKDSVLVYPGNQHPAEWHLFSDLNRVERPGNSPVVRVLDPEEADLFYVPFFSSLSLVVGPNGGGYSDEETQEGLVRWLEEQEWWKRNNGWDHVFVCQDPNALYRVVDRVRNGVLLVSDFGRLGRETASLVKDVILPYSHRIRTFDGDVGVDGRKSLLFFMGNRYRKEGGKIRDLLFQLLENEEDVIIKHGAQSRESRRAASQGMHTSKFCLHPAGDTPSACRLFDAIVSLCVPVVISNQIELPFEDVIDYRKVAIFVDSALAVKPGYLVKLLRGVSTDRLLDYQQELKKVKHYFEYDNPNGTVNEIWRQVSQKLPLIKLMINRDKRLVPKEFPEPDCACLCSNQSGVLTTL